MDHGTVGHDIRSAALVAAIRSDRNALREYGLVAHIIGFKDLFPLVCKTFADSREAAAYIDAQARKAVAARTRELVADSFARLSPLLGLYPKKVTVKKMTASWGRCSSSGNISINSAIVFYDRECIDYVVAHELCHLRHMDHSPDFWALVSTVCPEWKRIRARLR